MERSNVLITTITAIIRRGVCSFLEWFAIFPVDYREISQTDHEGIIINDCLKGCWM